MENQEMQEQEMDAVQQEETLFGLPAWIFQTGASFVVDMTDEPMETKPEESNA